MRSLLWLCPVAFLLPPCESHALRHGERHTRSLPAAGAAYWGAQQVLSGPPTAEGAALSSVNQSPDKIQKIMRSGNVGRQEPEEEQGGGVEEEQGGGGYRGRGGHYRDDRHGDRYGDDRYEDGHHHHHGAGADDEGSGVPGASVLPIKDKWMRIGYWFPLLCSAGFLLLMTEITYPVFDKLVTPTLAVECLLFACTMIIFGAVVIFTWDPDAAGHTQLVAMAAMMGCFAILVLLFTASFFLQRWQQGKGHEHDPSRTLALDIALQFRQFARIAVLFLVANVIVHELDLETGGFMMMAAFVLLGVALAVAGVITDVISHIFIRLDEHFYEGDILQLTGPGSEVQVEHMGWRHTTAMGLASRAQVTIPNRMLSIGDKIVNLSRDKGRKLEYIIPLAGGLPAEALETIVKEAWLVVKASKEEGFKLQAPSGKAYSDQILPDKCQVFIASMGDSAGGGEFNKFQLKLVLEGRYWYSNPPPWTGSGPEPEKIKRQMEWKAGWFAHVEWILVGVRKVVEKHQSKSQVNVKTGG